jgi:hypothetical protein
VFNRLPTYIKEESDNAKKFLKKFTEIFEWKVILLIARILRFTKLNMYINITDV